MSGAAPPSRRPLQSAGARALGRRCCGSCVFGESGSDTIRYAMGGCMDGSMDAKIFSSVVSKAESGEGCALVWGKQDAEMKICSIID